MCEGKNVIRVIIANMREAFVAAIEMTLNSAGNFEIAGKPATLAALHEMLQSEPADVLLLDPRIINNNYDQLRTLRTARDGMRVIVVAVIADRHMAEQIIKIGADGYVLMDYIESDLLKAIEITISGGEYISPTVFKEK